MTIPPSIPDLSYIDRMDDLDQLATVMINAEDYAERYGDGGDRSHASKTAWSKAFARTCSLVATRFSAETEAERDAGEAIAAYEWVLSEKNDRKTYATRVRRMVKQHGILSAIARAVSNGEKSLGLRILADRGQLSYAFENVVLRHPDAFDADIVATARQTMDAFSTQQQ